VSGQRPRATGRRNVLLGIALLARGRAEGLAQFDDSVPAFLASLAPLIAFPLVRGIIGFSEGDELGTLTGLLATVCALIAPPVISEALARVWHRQARWLRYATAFNWCQWAVVAFAALLLLGLGTAMSLGLPNRVAGPMLVAGLLGYGCWLHWFLLRRALEISAWQAAFAVVCINFGTAVLLIAPMLLARQSGSAVQIPG
jgi:hypothetical protein